VARIETEFGLVLSGGELGLMRTVADIVAVVAIAVGG
jgi:hypothetical protein